jgi:aryl-alcohol dehydrogenase-like predicted oxidoreductase
MWNYFSSRDGNFRRAMRDGKHQVPGSTSAFVQRLKVPARKKGCKPAQLALAWVLAQGEDIVPSRCNGQRQSASHFTPK